MKFYQLGYGQVFSIPFLQKKKYKPYKHRCTKPMWNTNYCSNLGQFAFVTDPMSCHVTTLHLIKFMLKIPNINSGPISICLVIVQ